ncbi:hypothetical protein BsWGS_27534 [Bradybaena similaris]
MSESEGEATFASADEGDGVDKGDAPANKELESTKTDTKRKKDGAVTAGDKVTNKRKEVAAESKEAQKGQKKQQQPPSKGKGNTAAAQKDVKPTISPPPGAAAKASPGGKNPKPVVKPPEESKSEGKVEKTKEVKEESKSEGKVEKTKEVKEESKSEGKVEKTKEVKEESKSEGKVEKTKEVKEESKSEGKEAKTKEDLKVSAVNKPAAKIAATSAENEKDVQKVDKTNEPAVSTLSVKKPESVSSPQRQGGSVAGGQLGGSVQAEDVRGKVQVEDVRGKVQVEDVRGKVRVEDVRGKVQVEDVREKGEVQAEDVGPVVQDIPRGQRDHTPEQEEVLKKLGESAEKGSAGGWGWGNWGSSLLSAATNSVQTFTHQVGDGFTTILETVESSLGVPDPEDIAKARSATEPEEDRSTVISQPDEGKQEDKVKMSEDANQTNSNSEATDSKEDDLDEKLEEKKEEPKKETSGGDGWFSNWNMSDFAKKVQDKGKSLASKGHTLMAEGFDAVENLAAGGIDVLESIGKKTYSTLSEHDPAFRKTREFLSPKGNKPNLSSVLREAKEKAEFEAEQEKQNEEARKAHFGTLFDDYQGIAHLEALEILSNQSEKKVHSLLNALSSGDLTEIKPTLISIKEAFEINEEDSDAVTEQDFSSLVSQCVSDLQLGTAPDKLNKVHEMVKQWIVDCDSHEAHESDSIKEVHQKSIQALAELTAKGVEQFHKAGELVLLERDKDKDCTERAHSLARLTGVLCHEISNLASKFVEILNKMAVCILVNSC